ncbi:MAG: AsnC family transcriptional regulator [Desulfobacteraceae bacterium]|nr:AsnC family transcriptional regulator [Desulfobacteraceae bacterium]MCF8093825.1 AsnC family transcriptional regulator [Desulfobacteraceae bacterium]
MNYQLDDIDKALLNRIQSDFPIAPRPFAKIAEELNLIEDEVIEKIRRLKEKDIIRRVGGNFSPERLGYVSTLCAGKVPEEKLEHFTRTINSYPGVTHNYLRDNSFNVWFTFIAPSAEEIEKNLAEISEKTGIRDILNLPATRVYKIRAHFNLK